jgi:transcriptional regulator with XRE-family HTH domain
MNYKELIEDLKNEVKKSGVPRKTIAKNIGMEVSNLNRILSGKHSPSVSNVFNIASQINKELTLVDKK